MRTETKLIKTKLGLINLAEHLGSLPVEVPAIYASGLFTTFIKNYSLSGALPIT